MTSPESGYAKTRSAARRRSSFLWCTECAATVLPSEDKRHQLLIEKLIAAPVGGAASLVTDPLCDRCFVRELERKLK